MRYLAFVASIPLLLTGCNYAPSTSITTTTINGKNVLHSIVTTPAPGVTKFECAESASGNCNYAVFTNVCAAAANDATTTTCTTRLINEFTLAMGEAKELAGLPADFKHCVNQDLRPAAPACSTSGL